MSTARVKENCFLQTSHNDLIKLKNYENSVLMSLFDDSQVEDEDDESLRSVIQSLEAEIVDQDLFMEASSEVDIEEDYQLSDVEQMNNCSTSKDQLDFQWADVDMEYSGDEVEYSGAEMAGYIQGRFDDSQIFHGTGVAEAEYTGLWEQAYESNNIVWQEHFDQDYSDSQVNFLQRL